MIPYTVLPPQPWPDEADDGPDGGPDWPAPPDEPSGPWSTGRPPEAGRLVDVWLGVHHGVPVRALAWWDGSRLRLERLVTTAPDLYLLPGLAPGAGLPVLPGETYSPS